uniref:Macaca fascicularis brain cDNA clone: QmoA-12296, similar to human KIAA0725 protein (KIAA0725), mRNA, RefSeq: XM_291291.3 n=1 Tax=Macaca fascicularis TaxID=9541 RepID=I7GJX1_MACFA|nr:unnamed protein product [Macaca fascicularis]
MHLYKAKMLYILGLPFIFDISYLLIASILMLKVVVKADEPEIT